MSAIKKVINLPTKQTTKSTSSVWPFATDYVEDWAYWDNVFTPEECKELIKIGESQILTPGTIFKEGVDLTIRECNIAWLYPEDMDWAYKKIVPIVNTLNNDFFKFDLFGLTEGFQFTKYEAPSGHYGAHIDKCFRGLVRKLSITIQLSNPENYEGGQLALHLNGSSPTLPTKEQGKLIAFPSYVLHEVQPITKGTRYSLVAWVPGAPFK